jgi:succinyl-diaminopimelate desuccinylase
LDDDSIEFLRDLLKLDSTNPPGDESQVAQKLVERAHGFGLEASVQQLGQKRVNVVVKLAGKKDRKPFLFCGHMDTVGIGGVKWEYGPFSGEIANGKMYGRGASDMKSGLAAMLEAMGEIKNKRDDAPRGDIYLIATAGEEVDCLGAVAATKGDILDHAGAMIIGEPTNQEVVITHKGALWLKITTYGKTSHASMPDLGVNAILKMDQIVDTLKNGLFADAQSNPLLGKPTINIGTIKGGVQTNVVPDQCEMTIDIRTLPGTSHDQLVHKIKHKLDKLDVKYKLEILHNLAPLNTPPQHWLVEEAVKLDSKITESIKKAGGINFYTDGSIFGQKYDFPIIIYGPGKRELAHQPNEYIKLDSYLQSIRYYTELAQCYFNHKSR